jgi:hypothetical protein
MNALIAMAKGLSIALNAMGQESGLRDFISATAKNAPERESALVPSAAGQVFKHRHNQTDPATESAAGWAKSPQQLSIVLWPRATLSPLQMIESGQCSSLRQSGLAHPVKAMLDVLWVLVDHNTFVSFNCETGVDPQHLRRLFPGLLNLSQLGIGGREKNMERLDIWQLQCTFAQPTQRLSVPFKQVIGLAHKKGHPGGLLKRI